MTAATDATATDEAKRLGEVGLHGWRKFAADLAAPRVASVTRAGEQDAKAWIGLAFVALSAWHVGSTVVRFLRAR